ncbi:hypothetical protein WJ438_35450 [Streptomyces sp. GD-15H]|uniref:hypothetical protein n=1 Tax=Streptomyces sp. GD-15H TaxID=3129112 RepID=UPI0032491270
MVRMVREHGSAAWLTSQKAKRTPEAREPGMGRSDEPSYVSGHTTRARTTIDQHSSPAVRTASYTRGVAQ